MSVAVASTAMVAVGQTPQAAADAPVIDAIHFSGNTKLTSAALAQAITLKAGEPIAKDKVKAALDRIVASYRAGGYNLSVSPDISHPAAGHVVVTFKIDESGISGDAGPAPGPGGGGAPPPPR